MHAEALTRSNLSCRPVLPFREVYDERGERSARGLKIRARGDGDWDKYK